MFMSDFRGGELCATLKVWHEYLDQKKELLMH